MFVAKAGGKKFTLRPITRRVESSSILICLSPNGRLPSSLKEGGLKFGSYCTLAYWTEGMGRRRRCMVRHGGRGVLVEGDDLRYLYSAVTHRRWVQRSHRALVKALREHVHTLQAPEIHRGDIRR